MTFDSMNNNYVSNQEKVMKIIYIKNINYVILYD